MSSAFEDTIREQLRELFPHATIKEQYYVAIDAAGVFFDFYLPHLKLFIECQGKQHYEYSAHFHGDKKAFLDYKKRDELKRQWVKRNKQLLVEIKYSEVPTNAAGLFRRIKEAVSERLNA